MKFKKKQLKLFWYWINERHAIWESRKQCHSWPWTSDKILRKYKFTNVFRQLDRVTEAWTNRFVTLLGRGKRMTLGDLLFQCAMFRYFNLPETYDALYFAMGDWRVNKAIKILQARKAEGKQIFTGAYIITSGGKTQSKIKTICEALNELYLDRHEVAEAIHDSGSMENAVTLLSGYPTVGPFVAYEIACDLRHTRLLAHATDINSWANAGPGAKRGIHRLITGTKDKPEAKVDYVKCMRWLLAEATVGRHLNIEIFSAPWPFEMREIEHSLCEFDKYMRAKNGEGKPRSLYKVTVPQWQT